LLIGVSIVAYLKFSEIAGLKSENVTLESKISTLENKVDSLKVTNSKLEEEIEQYNTLVLKVKQDYEVLLFECKGPRKK